MNEHSHEYSRELSEDEIEGVAGGQQYPWPTGQPPFPVPKMMD
jgi:hypothetical protein